MGRKKQAGAELCPRDKWVSESARMDWEWLGSWKLPGGAGRMGRCMSGTCLNGGRGAGELNCSLQHVRLQIVSF